MVHNTCSIPPTSHSRSGGRDTTNDMADELSSISARMSPDMRDARRRLRGCTGGVVGGCFGRAHGIKSFEFSRRRASGGGGGTGEWVGGAGITAHAFRSAVLVKRRDTAGGRRARSGIVMHRSVKAACWSVRLKLFVRRASVRMDVACFCFALVLRFAGIVKESGIEGE